MLSDPEQMMLVSFRQSLDSGNNQEKTILKGCTRCKRIEMRKGDESQNHVGERNSSLDMS